MAPMIWLGIMIVLIIIEAVTFGLTTIWFAGGALAAAIASFYDASILCQLLIFSGVSVVLLIVTRPLAVKSLRQTKIRTNVDSLIGKEAIVSKEINNLAQSGQVRINDLEWTARAFQANEIIPVNAVVKIEKVQGVKLLVTEVKGGNV